MADRSSEKCAARLRGYSRFAPLALVFVILAVAGVRWAVAQAVAKSEEDKVRAVSREFYGATAAGNASRCLPTVRLPMAVISNGLVTSRNEAQLRALLTRVAVKAAVKPLSAEERTRVDQRLRDMFDEADVTFIGADTAAVAFLLRAGTKADEGDLIAMLILHRNAPGWQVIAEIHDSTPVPRSYLPQDAAPPPAESKPQGDAKPPADTPPPPPSEPK